MATGKFNYWSDLKARYSMLRSLARERDRADAYESVLADKMRALKQKFDNEHAGRRQPARLCLHRTGRTMALRWRLSADRREAHDYFELRHDRSPGREVLDALPRTRRERYLKFQAEALVLNVAYALYRYQRDRLIQQIDKVAALTDTIRHYEAGAR